jgi:hypothetical protein
MANAPHHHPHPVVISASLLRMSALERLALAAGVLVVMWAVVFWAMV